ncbi:uncharacterized protein LOC116801790 [Drosophila sechellia]|uniref:uncharacterized protein LOC116801790 n=1 Tax=Drosophila sechellia TaxID=7238 RepID=UPI0013DDC717|nr:uncharacterized protein LOC116801790 [Drosophila sechellia]
MLTPESQGLAPLSPLPFPLRTVNRCRALCRYFACLRRTSCCVFWLHMFTFQHSPKRHAEPDAKSRGSLVPHMRVVNVNAPRKLEKIDPVLLTIDRICQKRFRSDPGTQEELFDPRN